MKRTYQHYCFAVATLLLLMSCDNKNYQNESPFKNVSYIDVATYKEYENCVFKRTTIEGKKELSALLAAPIDKNIELKFKVNAALKETYNKKYGTQYDLLDPKYYDIPVLQTTIEAGEISSSPISVNFKAIQEMPIDTTYLLPISIEQASEGMGILEGSSTVFYLVKKSSAITTAANLKDNFMRVPGFAGPTGSVVSDLKAITYEAIINCHDFAYGGAKNPTGAIITTVMGVEQYFLMRIGDADFPLEQVQIDGVGGKFPNKDNSKKLEKNNWYHLAVTYDIAQRTLTVYIDGKEQSKTTNYGKSGVSSLNLAITDPKAYVFYIGHSFEDDLRQLNGEISECRIWSVARTQQEIYENMYEIDPKTEGLVAYWKFNEGEGNVVKDQTGNGNDAIADTDLKWENNIEIPQKNREN